MRPLCVFLLVLLISGCAFFKYENEVKSLSDTELCQDLGRFTLHGHEDGLRISRNEVARRDIDGGECSRIANRTIQKLSPDYKLSLCQNLAAYHHQGNYRHFKQTLQKIEERNYADAECVTMAEFYFKKLSREEEEREIISKAIHRAEERMFGRGSASNPIHVEIQ